MTRRAELKRLEEEFHLWDMECCTAEEAIELRALKDDGKPLPPDIKYNDIEDRFYREGYTNLSENEIAKLCTLTQLKHLNSIRVCLKFFVILTVVALCIAVISAFLVASAL